MADALRVFLSYSRDSDEHAARVLALADALRAGGINVILDQYVHPAPEEGWSRWMDRCIDMADFVLMVCTEAYHRRVMGQEKPGKGPGVWWEGTLIYNRIHHDKPSGSRYIPILLPGSVTAHIPDPVRGHFFYRIAALHSGRPGLRGLVPLPDRPGTPASARPRHDHDLRDWHQISWSFGVTISLTPSAQTTEVSYGVQATPSPSRPSLSLSRLPTRSARRHC